MGGIVGLALAQMKNLPAREILFVLAGAQAVRPVCFTRLVDVNDGNQESAGHYAKFGRLEKISLQIVTNRDKVPAGWLDLEFPFFQIGNDCINFHGAFQGATAQNFNGGLCAVHGSNFPAAFRKPQSISARSARKIERLAWRPRRGGFY